MMGGRDKRENRRERERQNKNDYTATTDKVQFYRQLLGCSF
jgi:hypothetical protein